MGGRFRSNSASAPWRAIAATFLLAVSACGEGVPAAEILGSTTTDVDLTPLSAVEIETACASVFQAWIDDTRSTLAARLTPSTLSELATRTYSPGSFGLAAGQSGCFLTQHGADGSLIAVGDLRFERSEGSPLATSLVWTDPSELPSELAERLLAAKAVYLPGTGADAGPVEGAVGFADAAAPVAATPAPSPDGSVPPVAPDPGGPSSTPAANPTVTSLPEAGATTPGPGITSTPTTPAPTTAPPASLTFQQVADLQARCVYLGDAAACASLEQNGLPAAGNYGLGGTLSQAPEIALTEDCSASFRLACLELERRFPPAVGDDAVVAEFVNAVIAGDAGSAAAAAGPGLLAFVSPLGEGPYPSAPGVDIPGTSFTAGRLRFRLSPTMVMQCYVGTGRVRHCSVTS